MCRQKGGEFFFKFQDMLKENEIMMVLTVAKPEKIPYASTTLQLIKNKNKQWDVILKWDPVLKKGVNKETKKKDMHGFIHIIGLSVQGNWWFTSNKGEED